MGGLQHTFRGSRTAPRDFFPLRFHAHSQLSEIQMASIEFANLKLQPGEWYGWEVFPGSSAYPNCVPVLLRAMMRSPRLRGGLELELMFAPGSREGSIRMVDVHPKKKLAGYWVCRLPSDERPEPTVVISQLNSEWLYIHCPSIRRTLGERNCDKSLQSLLTEVYLNGASASAGR